MACAVWAPCLNVFTWIFQVSCTNVEEDYLNKVNHCSNLEFAWMKSAKKTPKKQQPYTTHGKVSQRTRKTGRLSCSFRESVFQWNGSRLVLAFCEWIRLLKGSLTDNCQPYQTQFNTNSLLKLFTQSLENSRLFNTCFSSDVLSSSAGRQNDNTRWSARVCWVVSSSV